MPTLPPGCDPESTLMLTPSRLLCPHHGQPFKAEWPRGVAAFIAHALKPLLASEDFLQVWRDFPGENDLAKIQNALDAAPVCCRTAPAELLLFYEQERLGQSGQCLVCGNVGRGVQNQRIVHSGGETFGHLCLKCLLFVAKRVRTNEN